MADIVLVQYSIIRTCLSVHLSHFLISYILIYFSTSIFLPDHMSSNSYHSESSLIPPCAGAFKTTFYSSIDIIIYFSFKGGIHYNAISMRRWGLSPGQPEAQHVPCLLSGCLLPSWMDSNCVFDSSMYVVTGM